MSDFDPHTQFYPAPMEAPTPAVEMIPANTGDIEAAAAQGGQTLKWMKRTLVAGAIAGIAYGGYEAATHMSEVESSVKQHDAWAEVVFPVTEGLAWGSTPFLLGSAARKLGTRKIKFKELPDHMRALEDSKVFQASMAVNMTGAFGTTAALVVGAESLPESTRPLVYGVAAGSMALSSIPIKVAYMIDKHNRKEGK